MVKEDLFERAAESLKLVTGIKAEKVKSKARRILKLMDRLISTPHKLRRNSY